MKANTLKLAKIGTIQFEDYAKAKKWTLDRTKPWSANHLDNALNKSIRLR